MDPIGNYNVVWTSQSRHSGESMPVGGYDIGLNVWAEQGEVLFYLDRSGSFDENNQMLKLGRVRLSFDPNPFADGAGFRQELKLREGCVEIRGTRGELEARVDIWVEVHRPAVHAEIFGSLPFRVEAAYENWRLQEREIPRDKRMACLSTVGYPGVVTTKPDTVGFDNDGICFYHRNRNEELFFDKVVRQQGLDSWKDRMWNPQKNLTFGGFMAGEGMIPAGTEERSYLGIPCRAWKLRSEMPGERHHLLLYLHTSAPESAGEWFRELRNGVEETFRGLEKSRAEARAWWNEFWQRSYIAVQPENPDPASRPWQAGRNYQLFRYMLGCNAYGSYPTKFNGGLFTSDPRFVSDGYETESADFRRWGGGSFTAQNQRLVYWPMLKSGDFEMMRPQFEFYRRALANAELRTKVYWGHNGCSFTEQLENFGLPIGWGWGWNDSYDRIHLRTPFSDPTEQIAPWIRYLYVNQLEFSFMILRYFQYSGREIGEYLPFIESAVVFVDEHYQYRHFLNTARRLDENGRLVFFPSTACETYKNATNPADLISAMEATVRALLELPEELLPGERREYYESLLARIPPLSFREREGRLTIAPAQFWTEIINVELPQLYPVFPYELYGIGKADLQTAIDTWHYGADRKEQKNHISWHQDPIFCARLGLAEEAAELTLRKLEDGPQRFPAFWGPGHDWLPDHNWGGSGMIALQDMLLQCSGRTIYLLPAWPKDWDADFKLHALYQTTVEGKVRNGKLVELKVTPESRLGDVIDCTQTR
jgi:hypothetical protein